MTNNYFIGGTPSIRGVDVFNNMQTLCGRIITENAIVDYDSIIKQAYPQVAHPNARIGVFVGFKIALVDNYANTPQNPNTPGSTPADQRMRELETVLPRILGGRGCFLREFGADGLILCTAPVPKQHMAMQINNICIVISELRRLGIEYTGNCVEINISAQCNAASIENVVMNVFIPDEYKKCIIEPVDSAYKHVKVDKLTANRIRIRTKFSLTMPNGILSSQLAILAQMISSALA